MILQIIRVAVVSTALLMAQVAHAEDSRVEDQSAFKTGDGSWISSTALAKLLTQKLDTAYQDLELVFNVCQSGEFGPRLKSALAGNFSIITMSDASTCATVERTKGNFDIPKGGPKKDIPGLHIDSHYFHGPAAQYVEKLELGKNTVTNKQLYDAANNKDLPDATPQYTSSGATADNFTVHGGKSSNHAIVFSVGTDFGSEIANELATFALKQAGYTGMGDITQLSVANATKQNLENALSAMGTALKTHPREEKGYIYIDAHGSYQERTGRLSNRNDGTGGRWRHPYRRGELGAVVHGQPDAGCEPSGRSPAYGRRLLARRSRHHARRFALRRIHHRRQVVRRLGFGSGFAGWIVGRVRDHGPSARRRLLPQPFGPGAQ